VVRRLSSDGGFAGTPLSIVYEVANGGRLLPIWSLRLTDRVTADDRVLETRRAERAWNEAAAPAPSANEDAPVELAGSVGFVPARSARTTSIVCRFEQRGTYKLGPLEASTTFPFSLMSCDALFPDSRDTVWIYPRRLSLRRGWTELLPPRRGGEGERSTGGANQDGDFFGLRPWQSGDQPKHIHWRTTARIGEPAVRQFEQRSRHQVCLLVDPVVASDSPVAVRAFEQSLRLAATLLCELSGRTASVSLVDPGAGYNGSEDRGSEDRAAGDSGAGDSGAGDSGTSSRILTAAGTQLSGPLKCLAALRYVIDDAASIRPLSAVVDALAAELERYDLVVVSSRSFEQAVSAECDRDDPARRFWQFFQRRNRLAWLNVQSKDVSRYFAEMPDASREARPFGVPQGEVPSDALR
jgi:hypothetical protein